MNCHINLICILMFWIFLKQLCLSQAWGRIHLILALGRRQVDLWELKASVVYGVPCLSGLHREALSQTKKQTDRQNKTVMHKENLKGVQNYFLFPVFSVVCNSKILFSSKMIPLLLERWFVRWSASCSSGPKLTSKPPCWGAHNCV